MHGSVYLIICWVVGSHAAKIFRTQCLWSWENFCLTKFPEGHTDPSEREGVAETDYRHNSLQLPLWQLVWVEDLCSRIHVQIILETIQTTWVIDTVKWEILLGRNFLNFTNTGFQKFLSWGSCYQAAWDPTAQHIINPPCLKNMEQTAQIFWPCIPIVLQAPLTSYILFAFYRRWTVYTYTLSIT